MTESTLTVTTNKTTLYFSQQQINFVVIVLDSITFGRYPRYKMFYITVCMTNKIVPYFLVVNANEEDCHCHHVDPRHGV